MPINPDNTVEPRCVHCGRWIEHIGRRTSRYRDAEGGTSCPQNVGFEHRPAVAVPADHSDCLPGWCIYPPSDPHAEHHGPAWRPDMTARIRERLDDGENHTAIARALDVSVDEVLAVLDEDEP
jgi:hypothetical protein